MDRKLDLTLEQASPQGIRPSRFVAGIALHFAVPAYLMWLAVVLLPLWGTVNPDRVATIAGHASIRFLIAYAVFVVAITLATRSLEPSLRQARARREARDPQAASRLSKARLKSALKLAETLGAEPRVCSAIERIRVAPWKHDDQRFQAIAFDLARTSQAFATAVDRAEPQEREELLQLAAGTFDRIAEAVEQLAEEQRRLDHGDARTLARYIELRYPSSDFASEQNS